MKVYCPKCNACYELDDSIVNNKQRKLRCSKCKEVFVADDLRVKEAEILDETVKIPDNEDENIQAHSEDKVEQKLEERLEPKFDNGFDEVSHEDVSEGNDDTISEADQNEENKEDSEEGVNLEAIFARLSEHTESLFVREKKLPIHEKIWFQIKNVLGFHFKIKWSYVLMAFAVFVVISSYNNRYQIVRKAPFLNSVYKAFGIKAKIPGEGLEFGNISWDFISEDEGTKLEIKGFINNATQKAIVIPRVHIEILDKNTVLLQSQNRKMQDEPIAANSKIPLKLTIKNPAPTAKYVYLTFIDRD